MTLLELANACERAKGEDRELDARIASIVRLERVPDWARNWSGEWRPTETGSVVMMQSDGTPGPHFMANEYTASLDAAMRLAPDGMGFYLNRYWLLSGEAWSCTISAGGLPGKPAQHFECFDAKNASLAICAAALRARHAMESE